MFDILTSILLFPVIITTILYEIKKSKVYESLDIYRTYHFEAYCNDHMKLTTVMSTSVFSFGE